MVSRRLAVLPVLSAAACLVTSSWLFDYIGLTVLDQLVEVGYAPFGARPLKLAIQIHIQLISLFFHTTLMPDLPHLRSIQGRFV